jgi:hypothetical protein
MGTIYQPDEIDFVNPYLSPIRTWICTQLAILLPNNVVTVASNDKKTSIFFEDWTGQSQTKLETAWLSSTEGFRRAVTKEEKAKGVFIRDTAGGPCTTSCEGLIGSLLRKLTAAGFGTPNRGNMTTFNLAGCGPNGREPATTRGWHWYRDRTEALHPRPGDLFQVGVPANPGQWSFKHVGVITLWAVGANPSWTTVEAGQGGPAKGFDFIARKGPRPLNPIDPASPKKELMGWIDIDEFFGG